jgi:ABC-2 type transport system ATP-binding protein
MKLEAAGLSKYYGKQKALDRAGFVIDKPQVVALLGPNGAGKSTLMKILTTYIRPDEGTAYLNEYSVMENPMQIRKIIGYLPEHNPLYTEMYVFEYLEFIGKFYGTNRKRIFETVEMTGLLPESHKKIGQLSKGYRQRVGLSAALLHNPDILILDEPTTGLDPGQVIEIRNLIKSLGKEKIILMSTHIMQEVQKTADRVIMLKKGRVILDKTLDEIRNNSQIITVRFDQRIETEFFGRLPGIKTWDNIGNNVWELQFETGEDARPLVFDFAVRNGLKILYIETTGDNLEKWFEK